MSSSLSLQNNRPEINPTLHSALRLSDFTEAHSECFLMADGKMLVLPDKEDILIALLKSLYSEDVLLIAGKSKSHPVIPGYTYSIVQEPPFRVSGNPLVLKSHQEDGAMICLSLLTFLNAFCDNPIPQEGVSTPSFNCD